MGPPKANPKKGKKAKKHKRQTLTDRTAQLVKAAQKQREDDADPVMDDLGDLSYFEGGQGAALMSNMMLEEPMRKKKKRKKDADDKVLSKPAGKKSKADEEAEEEDNEMEFESRPRKWAAAKSTLPVFSSTGQVARSSDSSRVGGLQDPVAAHKPVVSPALSWPTTAHSPAAAPADMPPRENDSLEEDESGGPVSSPAPPKSLTEQETLQKAMRMMKERKKRRQTIKQRMATTCMAVQQDPHTKYKSLADVVGFCNDADPVIVKLGLISCTAVFKDIVPGYRIRDASDEEAQEERAAQNYGKMRAFEIALLKHYQLFNAALDSGLKGHLLKPMAGLSVDKEDHAQVREVAIQCIGSLMAAHPHFNYTKLHMTRLLPCVESKLVAMRKTAQEAFMAVLQSDVNGEKTLEVCRLVSNEVKRRKYGSGKGSMALLLSVRLREDLLTDTALAKEIIKKKKKKRKDDDVAKEMAQAEAEHRRDRVLITHQPRLYHEIWHRTSHDNTAF